MTSFNELQDTYLTISAEMLYINDVENARFVELDQQLKAVCIQMDEFAQGYDLDDELHNYCEQEQTPKSVKEAAPMNTPKIEMNDMTDVNQSQLVSTMAGALIHTELTPTEALIVAAAFVDAAEYHNDNNELWVEVLAEFIMEGKVEIGGQVCNGVDIEKAVAALIKAEYLLSDGTLGYALNDLIDLRTEAYAPALASEGVTRRFGYSPINHGKLFVDAVHVLEKNEFTTDQYILELSRRVQAALLDLDSQHKDDEAYVLTGSGKLDPKKAYVSEFKGDRRVRAYQAACHGPNGQSSDRARALMDLVGVPTDYNIRTVRKHIIAEMEDMCSDVKASMAELKELGAVQFVVKHELADHEAGVKKPYSFVKAANVIVKIDAGQRPYIGMAIGLDAKCSGPQLAALMVGDQKIAAACGMTLEELDDAYELCIEEMVKSGFGRVSRGAIKKAYMGVFYGQGWAAYTVETEVHPELWAAIYEGKLVSEARAKLFHKTVQASFGTKMNNLRKAIKEFGKVSSGKTKHMMPDGSEVAMNYKHKLNVLGEMMDWETTTPDAYVSHSNNGYKFIKPQFSTLIDNSDDFARNGFVNMIQATDALLARLIIVNLDRLGARHVIAVHDCFRVNVTEMHLLEQAIKNAYAALFGNNKNVATADLPYGTDILGLYFEGAKKQVIEGCDIPATVSQFTKSGLRFSQKINGKSISSLIEALGTSYYFAK